MEIEVKRERTVTQVSSDTEISSLYSEKNIWQVQKSVESSNTPTTAKSSGVQ